MAEFLIKCAAMAAPRSCLKTNAAAQCAVERLRKLRKILSLKDLQKLVSFFPFQNRKSQRFSSL